MNENFSVRFPYAAEYFSTSLQQRHRGSISAARVHLSLPIYTRQQTRASSLGGHEPVVSSVNEPCCRRCRAYRRRRLLLVSQSLPTRLNVLRSHAHTKSFLSLYIPRTVLHYYSLHDFGIVNCHYLLLFFFFVLVLFWYHLSR